MKGVLSKILRLVFVVLLIINTVPRNLYADGEETAPAEQESIVEPAADPEPELSIRELTMPLEEVLKHYTGAEKVRLIPCGGSDPIAAAREQWNDGSNTLCVSPGVIIVYSRNELSNNLLREEGLTVLEIPSSELSRGRGGPRCMSMPLNREPFLIN